MKRIIAALGVLALVGIAGCGPEEAESCSPAGLWTLDHAASSSVCSPLTDTFSWTLTLQNSEDANGTPIPGTWTVSDGTRTIGCVGNFVGACSAVIDCEVPGQLTHRELYSYNISFNGSGVGGVLNADNQDVDPACNVDYDVSGAKQ